MGSIRGLQQGVTAPRGGGKFYVDSAVNTNSGSVRRLIPAGSHSDVIGQATRSTNFRKRRDDTGFYPDAVGPRCILNVPPRCEARFNYRRVDSKCYWLIAA